MFFREHSPREWLIRFATARRWYELNTMPGK
jgi:hypothetical protein